MEKYCVKLGARDPSDVKIELEFDPKCIRGNWKKELEFSKKIDELSNKIDAMGVMLLFLTDDLDEAKQVAGEAWKIAQEYYDPNDHYEAGITISSDEDWDIDFEIQEEVCVEEGAPQG